MSGVGPVEPGEGTHAWDAVEPGDATRAWDTAESPGTDPSSPSPSPSPRAHPHPRPRTRLAHAAHTAHTALAARFPRLARSYGAHRRAALSILAACALLAGGGYLYATRPHDPQPAALAPPFPSQVVDVTYLGGHTVPPGAPPRTFAFEVLLEVDSGPPVTVTRMAQPYAGLSVTSAPRAPFRTTAGSARTIVVTMHVTECGTVPANAGLPFLDVTLRNARAIQVHSYILGPNYAQDLSDALQVACSNDFR
ncbi:Tat pathway signal sequence domain protein [Streptomyces sp. NBC_01275]|uniref:Tat pathway signal sequence domain protein n=1 Tax=Streptomyces sp. NBC_01275 TaxID=2903807 RepID=UPI002259D563|nr:Tat pathway signal sequence domain protein [Streptomyces sp. NBC_01275]MCX4761224.1 Tat pathway signal sequence domain protein [Streptomyces sp. NBC_01275]